MSNESAPIRDAPAPFSGVSDPNSNGCPSDFILRSSDGVDFHVHREILKFSSDFYDDMFAIPGGDGDPNGLRRDGNPVLLMPEPEVVLLRLTSVRFRGRGIPLESGVGSGKEFELTGPEY
ncbi:BTB domain-containing protein [Mycena venus]|uniref:BTB domain-containing protein n=1 Tax=Mycena venus TaxID=2733690 RepID=A0A8H7CGL4_9AGAR|nr:BTB domain-containing protein [Mycena venus]